MRSLLIQSTLLIVLCSAARQPFSEDDGIPALDSYLSVPTPAPVIGVLTQPCDWQGSEKLYIAASYVKWVEAGGAQVVPVFSDRSEQELILLFSKLNGLLVPGGAQDLRPGEEFYDAANLFTNLAIQAYDSDGEVFPIYYTCLGWEAAAVKFTNNPYILSNFTGALGVAAELSWTPAAMGARSLQLVPPEVLEQARKGKLAYEFHHYGVWLPDFMGSELANTFDLLSTTRDSKGKVYVSTVQAKTYPFIATQWHPEKNLFEFSSPSMPHSLPAKQLSQAFANQFATWAQLSTHRFDNEEELKEDLIYNYMPIPGPSGYFAQIYFFNHSLGEG